ncbi:YdcF family protein [bacterium AH-315-O15]|nr:YdcF family protein [bacterium AH-315-O15]
MPPSRPAPGGTFRRTLLAVSLVVLALGLYGFVHLGSFLAKEDALQHADAVLVLSGSPMARPLEGADLYLAGYAPRIVLTRDQPAGGMPALAARGILFISPVTRAHGVFLQLGIPHEAIVVPARVHRSTAAEAVTLRELATREGWRRVIVVSSKYHLRRAGFALRRELRGTDIQTVMRSTRYEDFEPDQWWRRRGDIREIVRELPKLLAYLLGLGA